MVTFLLCNLKKLAQFIDLGFVTDDVTLPNCSLFLCRSKLMPKFGDLLCMNLTLKLKIFCVCCLSLQECLGLCTTFIAIPLLKNCKESRRKSTPSNSFGNFSS
ncbi:hypothetical protein BO221_49400 [Archangium sp. Cb G35]|nr:hypothetical protein BO221_49400 [Archangium sp. Cb G35]